MRLRVHTFTFNGQSHETFPELSHKDMHDDSIPVSSEAQTSTTPGLLGGCDPDQKIY
jgi:hypothetical protein